MEEFQTETSISFSPEPLIQSVLVGIVARIREESEHVDNPVELPPLPKEVSIRAIIAEDCEPGIGRDRQETMAIINASKAALKGAFSDLFVEAFFGFTAESTREDLVARCRVFFGAAYPEESAPIWTPPEIRGEISEAPTGIWLDSDDSARTWAGGSDISIALLEEMKLLGYKCDAAIAACIILTETAVNLVKHPVGFVREIGGVTEVSEGLSWLFQEQSETRPWIAYPRVHLWTPPVDVQPPEELVRDPDRVILPETPLAPVGDPAE